MQVLQKFMAGAIINKTYKKAIEESLTTLLYPFTNTNTLIKSARKRTYKLSFSMSLK